VITYNILTEELITLGHRGKIEWMLFLTTKLFSVFSVVKKKRSIEEKIMIDLSTKM